MERERENDELKKRKERDNSERVGRKKDKGCADKSDKNLQSGQTSFDVGFVEFGNNGQKIQLSLSTVVARTFFKTLGPGSIVIKDTQAFWSYYLLAKLSQNKLS